MLINLMVLLFKISIRIIYSSYKQEYQSISVFLAKGRHFFLGQREVGSLVCD